MSLSYFADEYGFGEHKQAALDLLAYTIGHQYLFDRSIDSANSSISEGRTMVLVDP